jgi:hypothetical protein
MFIEHPDHTGASSNPLAPWNWPDALPCECDECGYQSEALAHGDECEDCYGTMIDPNEIA